MVQVKLYLCVVYVIAMPDVSVGRMKLGDALNCVKTLPWSPASTFQNTSEKERTKVVVKPQTEGN